MSELAYLTAEQLTQRYRDRALSPVELTEHVLSRIERLDPELNAFVHVDAVSAVAAARESELRFSRGEARALEGVPISIKDLLPVHGWPTLRGSRTTDREQTAREPDAPVVARLREAGAIILGKTTTSEFGLKGAGDSPLTGITRNPYRSSHGPGGSSAGAVTSVAAGFGPIAIGTDGGGSIRVPSAYTGVFGLKPTFGRVAQDPPSFVGVPAHVGPIARTVADLARVLAVIAAPDPRDPLRAPLPALETSTRPLETLRIGVSATFGHAQVDPEIATAFNEAVASLGARGAKLEHADPGFESPLPVLRTLFAARAASTVKSLREGQRELLDPAVRAAALEGERLSAVDLLDAEAQRIELVQTMARYHQRFDLLLTPSTAFTAPAIGAAPNARGDQAPFTFPFSLTRQPALSLPIGLSSAGLPIGLQVVGRHFEDALVLSLAAILESTYSFRAPTLP